jgi:hypothetical protein
VAPCGCAVNVDTGAFQALTAQVEQLAEHVEHLTRFKVFADEFYDAGYRRGEADARAALLGRAAQTSREARPRGPRPAHLRAVDGGAS